MTPKIYHETIDKRFIEYLKAIDYSGFADLFDFDSFKPQYKELYVDLYFDKSFGFMFPCTKNAEWRLEVQFEVEYRDGSFYVSKDHEFQMLNLRTDKVIVCNTDLKEFHVTNSLDGYKGITPEFDIWIDGFFEWMQEN